MNEREEAFDRAFAYLGVNQIAGAVVELGVHNGLSLMALASRAHGRDVIGVDSFEGLPEPGPHDSDQFYAGALHGNAVRVREWARIHPLVGADQLRLVVGWFAEVDRITEPVALVHLDCDLYQSALDGLRLVDPVDGAVVLIDDWYCHRARPDMGVRRGWSEWLAETGRGASWFDRYGWHGSAWVVHREGTA